MIYRGYEITNTAGGKWSWTDERGFLHVADTDEEAMASVDRYKRNMANARSA